MAGLEESMFVMFVDAMHDARPATSRRFSRGDEPDSRCGLHC